MVINRKMKFEVVTAIRITTYYGNSHWTKVYRSAAAIADAWSRERVRAWSQKNKAWLARQPDEYEICEQREKRYYKKAYHIFKKILKK